MSRFKDTSATMTACGTPLYVAPEIFAGKTCARVAPPRLLRGSSLIHRHLCRTDDEAIDVYAFGLILYELVVRRRPMFEDFVKMDRAKFYNAVKSGLCVLRQRVACTTRPRASLTLAARPSVVR